MMRTVLLAAALAALPAMANACPAGPGPVGIDIRFEAQPTRYATAPAATIAQMTGGPLTRGVTRSTVSQSMRMTTATQPLSDGSVCAWLTEVSLVIQLDAVVYVDDRYRPGTCPYHVVMEHEAEHVRNLLALSQWRANLEQALAAVAAPPERGPATSVRGRLDARLQQALMPVLAAMGEERQRADWRLDTAENYQRTTARCPASAW